MATKPQMNRDADGWLRVEFDSVSQAMDYGMNGPGETLISDRRTRDQLCEMGGKFYNYYNADRVRAAIIKTPDTLLQAINRVREALMEEVWPPVTPRRKRFHRLDEGDELDVDRFLRGESEGLWSETRREYKPKSVVKIAVNVASDCSRLPEHLLYRGAAICALMDVLEQCDVSVEVTVLAAGRELSSVVQKHLIKITAKAAGEPLDIGAVAMATAELGFFRTVIFAAMCRMCPDRAVSHLGYVTSVPSIDANQYDLVVPESIEDYDSAIKFVKEQMSQRIQA